MEEQQLQQQSHPPPSPAAPVVLREWLVVGGGIAGVTAAEELLRLCVEEAKEHAQAQGQPSEVPPPRSRAQARHRHAPSDAAAAPQPQLPPVRVTLLHSGPMLQQVASSERHTAHMEEITALGAEGADAWAAGMRSKLQLHTDGEGPVQVRVIQGHVRGLDIAGKQVMYEEEGGSTVGDSAVQPLAPPLAAAPASPSSRIRRLLYDRVCFCTGARPSLFVEPPPGVPLPPQLLWLRDAASLARLSDALATPAPGGHPKRVVLVGNGGIALELVHAMHSGKMRGINTSDAVANSAEDKQSAAAAGSSAAASASAAAPDSSESLPPLSLTWVVKDPFLGGPFLDPMASAFLLPELFPHEDPPQASDASAWKLSGAAGIPDASSDTSTAITDADAAAAEAVSGEERIAGLERGKHVHTVLKYAEGAAQAGSTAASASAATAPSSAAASAAPSSVGAAVGPNWLRPFGVDPDVSDASSSDCAPHPHADLRLGCDLSLELNTEVAEMEVLDAGSSSYPLLLRLTNGHRIECDLVVSATGVRPNTEWAPPELLRAPDGGVLIDECMRTSLPDVFAAGDCSTLRFSPAFLAQHPPSRPCLFHPARLWSQAVLLGTYAARALSGQFEEELRQLSGFNFMLFTHTTLLLGRRAVLLGKYNLQGMGGAAAVRRLVQEGQLRTLVRCKPDGRTEFIKLHLLHGRLIGALLLGAHEGDANAVSRASCCGGGDGDALELAETFEQLMLNQTDLSEFGDFLNDVQVDLADYFD